MAISDVAYVYVYSSQAGTWSKPTSAAVNLFGRPFCPIGHGALVGNALYFKVYLDLSHGILKYDLGTQEISSINLPPDLPGGECGTLLTTTEYGEFGVASLESSRLHLWSVEAGPGGHLGWAPSRIIELSTILPANTQSIRVIAFLHGLGAILVSTSDGVFCVDLDSDRARKICEENYCINVVPFMCFCTPDMAPKNTGEEPVV